jgi:hypothetical protein
MLKYYCTGFLFYTFDYGSSTVSRISYNSWHSELLPNGDEL